MFLNIMTFSKKSPDTNLKLLSLRRVPRVFALAPLILMFNYLTKIRKYYKYINLLQMQLYKSIDI